MSLNLDYKLTLYDEASSPLQKVIEKTLGADSAVAKLQQSFGKMLDIGAQLKSVNIGNNLGLEKFAALEKQQVLVKNTTQAFGSSIESLRQKIHLLQGERDLLPQSAINSIRKYNSEIKSLESRIQHLSTINGGGIQSKIGEAMQQIPFAGMMTNPFIVAGAVAGKSLQTGIQMEMQKASFDTILGSKEAGQVMFDDIAKYAKASPFEKMGLADNAKTMLGYGVAADKIMPSMKMLGDVAMGDQNKLNLLTYAFSQISATGHLMGQDMHQLVNAGFNPLKEISKMTGESMDDLQQRMADGKISITEVENAFKHATSEGGMFYGMADKMGQTLGGRWSTFMDTLAELGLKIYEVLEPMVKPIVEFLIVGVDWLGQSLGGLIASFKEGSVTGMIIAGVLGALVAGYAAVSIWTGISTLATWLQTSAMIALNASFLANPIFWVVGAFAALTAGVIYAWNHFEGFRKFLYGLWESFKQIFSNIGKFFTQIFSPIGETIAAFQKGDWAGVAIGAAKLGANLMTAPAQFVAFALSGELTKGVGDAYKKGEAIGSASYKADQQKKEDKATGSTVKSPANLIKDAGHNKETKDNKKGADGKSAGSSGGGSGKNVTVHINKIFENIQIYTTNLRESEAEIRRRITESVIAGVGDAEVAIAT